jgi:hypothetical protein
MRDYPSNQRMLLFSGSANPEFTDKIAEHLGIKVGAKLQGGNLKTGKFISGLKKA